LGNLEFFGRSQSNPFSTVRFRKQTSGNNNPWRYIFGFVGGQEAAASRRAAAHAYALLETKMIGAICDSKTTPADNTDRLPKRLNLTDPQKRR
jgi:hypothetical protein